MDKKFKTEYNHLDHMLKYDDHYFDYASDDFRVFVDGVPLHKEKNPKPSQL